MGPRLVTAEGTVTRFMLYMNLKLQCGRGWLPWRLPRFWLGPPGQLLLHWGRGWLPRKVMSPAPAAVFSAVASMGPRLVTAEGARPTYARSAWPKGFNGAAVGYRGRCR